MLSTVAATTVVYAPMLLFSADIWTQVPWLVGPAWFAILVLAAPTTALLLGRRRPVATTRGRALLLGLPQLPLAIALMRIDIWLDIRSGYLLAGSGEVEMAYGYGIKARPGDATATAQTPAHPLKQPSRTGSAAVGTVPEGAHI